MAHYFGALVRDLRDSYELRVGHRLTVDLLGARTGYSASMLGSIERGECLPESGTRVQSLDDALRAGGQLKILWPVVQRLGHCPLDDLAAATNAAKPGYRESGSNALFPGDDVERRELFQLAAAGLLAQTPLINHGEPIRNLAERMLGTAAGNSVEDWGVTCADHMHAVQTQPPATIRDDLVLDFATVQHSITRATAEKLPGLQRISAWLSVMHANVLTRLGEHGAARRWWTTARHAADASGDRDMRVWVRGYEAVFGLYTPRSPEALLILARNAQDLAGDRLSAGVLIAVAAEAQALAVLGRQPEAFDRVRHLRGLADRFTMSGESYGWGTSSTAFTSAWVHAFGGATEAAREARDQALAANPNYQNAVNVRLHEAISVGRSGGYNEALLLATAVMADLDPAYRTHMMTHTARRVLDTVPLDKRTTLPALGDYRLALNAPIPN
ncbi:hypothetical protein Sru01_15910 [Sphaerisporangium rufum]|uniref:Helix-turn-helix domain-containing protein n=2 Tax=Sphaerisporangium rufum TaxID=1381558 RepID=A0A919QYW7_9ACTN|nr:hypothetical protein Sru01_15910 [Sphaerisporangium rufum]